MNKLRIALGVVAVLMVGGGAHYGLNTVAHRAANQSLEAIRENLPPGGQLNVGRKRFSWYADTGAIHDLFYDSPTVSIAADLVKVKELDRDKDNAFIHAAALGFETLEIRLKDKGTKVTLKGAVFKESNLGTLATKLKRGNLAEVLVLAAAGEVGLRQMELTTRSGARLTIDALVAAPVRKGVATQVKIKGVSYSDAASKGAFALGEAIAGDVVLAGLVSSLQGDEDGIDGLLRQVSRLQVSDVKLSKAGVERATLKSASLSDMAVEGTLLTRYTLRLTDLSAPVDVLDTEQRQRLAALGLKRLTLSLEMGHAYDPATQVLVTDPMTLTAAGMGSVSLTGRFADVDLRRLQAAHYGMDEIYQLVPQSLAFAYVDQGLAPSSLTQMAKADGLSRDQLADTAAQTILSDGPALLGDAFAAQLAVAAKAFILKPGTFKMTLTPTSREPLSAWLTKLQTSGNLSAVAEMTVTVE